MKKISYFTLIPNKDIEDIIKEYGKESLLVLSLLLRNYTPTFKIIFTLRPIFDYLKPNYNQRNNIIKCTKLMFGKLLPENVFINTYTFVPYNLELNDSLLILDRDVDKIINYEIKVDKFRFLMGLQVSKREQVKENQK